MNCVAFPAIGPDQLMFRAGAGRLRDAGTPARQRPMSAMGAYLGDNGWFAAFSAAHPAVSDAPVGRESVASAFYQLALAITRLYSAASQGRRRATGRTKSRPQVSVRVAPGSVTGSREPIDVARPANPARQ